MIDLGDFKAGAIVYGMWDTSGQDGASVTRGTNGTLRLYKNASNVERTSALGITDTEDFDGKTGVHHLAIDLSENTDVGFYAKGSFYFVVLDGAVIDTKTVNKALFMFSIEARGWVDWARSGHGTADTFGEVTAPPANFSAMAIDASGRVDVGKMNGAAVIGAGTSGNKWRA